MSQMYQINPIDNFFFRSSVPFEASGETTLVDGMFPPLPSVYSGALRPFRIPKPAEPSPTKTEMKFERSRTGFNGIWTEDYGFSFPMPLDLIPLGKDHYVCSPMALRKKPLSNFPLPYYLYDETTGNDKAKDANNLYLGQETMIEYLTCSKAELPAFKLGHYIETEPKLGIAVDSSSRTSQEGQLYVIKMLRPKNGMRFVADITNLSIKGEELIRFGGESKLARISAFDQQLDIPLSRIDSKYFKLYLATPAIFKNGWLPGWIDPETMDGTFSHKNKSVKLKLITAAVGKRIPIGGFGHNTKRDKETKKVLYTVDKPSEMRYGLPAGSVYYFRLDDGSFEDVIKLFHGKCISDYREDWGFEYKDQIFDRVKYCDRGFGYALVGSVSPTATAGINCRSNNQQEEMLNERH